MLMDDWCEIIGTKQEVEPGNRFSCAQPYCLWYVKSGEVDLFLKSDQSNITESLHHFIRIAEGQIFLGMQEQQDVAGWQLIARNCSDTEVYRINLPDFSKLSLGIDKVIASLIDEYLVNITKLILFGHYPDEYIDVANQENIFFYEKDAISTAKGVVWLSFDSATGYLNGDEGVTFGKDKAWSPVTSHSWMNVSGATAARTTNTLSLMQKTNIWSDLHYYYSVIIKLFLINIQNETLFNNIVLYDKVKNNQIAMGYSLAQLKSSYEEKYKVIDLSDQRKDDFFRVCQRLAEFYELPLKPLDKTSRKGSSIQKFKNLMDRSKIFYRKVYLSKNWYEGTHEPLWAVNKEKNISVALLPKEDKGYVVYDGATKNEENCDPNKVKTLHFSAYGIYRYFPNKVLRLKEILQFGLKYLRKELFQVCTYFTLIALLSFIPAFLTEVIFDNVIVASDKKQLWQIGIIFLVVIVAINAFELTKRYILLKIEATFDSHVQAAFWGRILKLPILFFRKTTPGELVSRITRLIDIRFALSGPLLIMFMNALFSLLSFFLLFYYCAWAALATFSLLALALVGYYALIKKRLTYETQVVTQQDKLFGMLGEFFSAIAKIRLTGSEYRIFFHWSNAFSLLQSCLRKSLKFSTAIKSLLDVFPLVLFGAVFVTIASVVNQREQLSTGQFLAFNAILGQMLVVIFDFLNEFNRVIEKLPYFERTKVFIETVPEHTDVLEEPGELTGLIELSNVSFRYPQMQHPILKGITIKIEPSEYVAVVGPSGSGKSTLLRLLMHFDQPTEGRIYFDNKDLNHLDIDMLRKQIGVVLQNDQLIPGDIFSNIAGPNDLTLKEAWELAEKVGIANDIREMPMRMYTMVNNQGGGLSGGQKERILIARALANQPKILILDEATRALDNVSQRTVVEQLSKMKMTRIVVAHRLSTLVDVDKIYVLESGQLIECGSFEYLMDKKDLFYRMAQRQMI